MMVVGEVVVVMDEMEVEWEWMMMMDDGWMVMGGWRWMDGMEVEVDGVDGVEWMEWMMDGGW